MKIDKKMLDAMLELPDDKLSALVGTFLGRFSVEKTRDTRRMAALRQVLEAVTESDLQRLSELMTLYKRSKK